ncbi:hypothetical protein HYH03_002188 [Edaphochlamys debaryana]|uniref:Uncharacterized protein n=1 Tax=Edaphochlamys debaryana TaxID=47281 RepID=A0A836C4I9_9CHLO|nr:hypothetical protein HYH03_002188 [Edaphochlamys debaryana]|eukprot:KAG2499900.1 hypothetical protein HYH03_002188 [Edaphochlamys debaryana]
MEEGAESGSPKAPVTNKGTRSSVTGFSGTGTLPKVPKASGSGIHPIAAAPPPPKKDDANHTSVVVQSDTSSELLKAERPDERVVTEIVGCLKMKGSMLAMGACERVKKIARVYPVEIANSAIMQELIAILKDNAATALAGSVMQALSIMALNPEGRQKVCLAGAGAPLIRFIRSADMSKPNLDRAVTLLMNLAADQTNRRAIREDGGVEALVELLKVAPVSEPVMEHALGALHNLALLDAKAKSRALEGGILVPLVRIITTKGLPDTDMCQVRGRMVLTELLKMPETEDKLAAVAQEMGVKL